jgi:sirohydrochlorin cobaltochelatase
MPTICEFLERQTARGPWSFGQVAIQGLALCHVEDSAREDLTVYHRPADARELAILDDAGAYRPLKTAPNLRHGWRLELATLDDLRLALDFFYPAALGTWLAFQRGELAPISLRETLERQTGMYRVTQLITDAQAREVIQKTCVAGCLRHRLWDIRRVEKTFAPHEVPTSAILCAEACNLLVAACRPVAKGNLPKVE